MTIDARFTALGVYFRLHFSSSLAKIHLTIQGHLFNLLPQKNACSIFHKRLWSCDELFIDRRRREELACCRVLFDLCLQ